MRLVIDAELDGSAYVLVIEGVGERWRDAFARKREEDPCAPLIFGASLDGGHEQMWALTAGAITDMHVEN